MGGESSILEDSSDTQLHSAFKKLKVDSKWSPSKISGSSEDLNNLWLRDPVADNKDSRLCSKTVKCCKTAKSKFGGHSSRMEPYPQDFLCSMAEKLTFDSEVCGKQSCQCSDLRKRSGKHYTNYASPGIPVRPVIREAKLKLHHSEKDKKQVIRAARLKIFKQGKHIEKKTGVKQLFGSQSSMKSSLSSRAHAFPLFGANTELSPSFNSVAAQNQHVGPPTKPLRQVNFSKVCYRSSSRVKRNYEHLSSDSESSRRQSFSDCGKEMRSAEQAKLEDVTVDELACYFEDFVHIPKKMSSMAEMMYT